VCPVEVFGVTAHKEYPQTNSVRQTTKVLWQLSRAYFAALAVEQAAYRIRAAVQLAGGGGCMLCS
jgi:hypothetical protein